MYSLWFVDIDANFKWGIGHSSLHTYRKTKSIKPKKKEEEKDWFKLMTSN